MKTNKQTLRTANLRYKNYLSKMKFLSFLSRISAVLGAIALYPYQDCALGPGQNKTGKIIYEIFPSKFSRTLRLKNLSESCPDTFHCTQTYQKDLIPGLRRPLKDGEIYENRKTCERFSCFCSGVEEKRGIFTIRKGLKFKVRI